MGFKFNPLTGKFDMFEAGKYRSNVTKKEGVVGSGQLTDPGMEAWDDANTLTNWTDDTVGGSGSITQESTIVHSGTYSCKINATGAYFIYQSKTGLTPDDYYVVGGYHYSADSADYAILLINGDLASFTQTWNFDTHSWDTTTNIDNDAYFDSGTSVESWTEYESMPITAPANGNITVLIINDGYETPTNLYVDDFDLYAYTPPDSISVFDFEAETFDATELLFGDYSLTFRSKGGTDKLFLGLNHLNMFDTTADWLGSTKDFLVPDTRSYYNSALNGMTGLCIASITEDIDLTTTGTTKLLTASNGKPFICTMAVIETQTADAPNADADISIGYTSPNYNETFAITDLSYESTANKYIVFTPTSAGRHTIDYEDNDIYINVSSADTGTAITVKVTLIGFYITE